MGEVPYECGNVLINIDSKYEKNKHYHAKYIKKRYTTDEEYRKKKVEINVAYNKKRYAEDPEFRQRVKDNVKNYRLRQKEDKLSK